MDKSIVENQLHISRCFLILRNISLGYSLVGQRLGIRQCRGHRFDLWSAKIPYATQQLVPCASTTEPKSPQACASQEKLPNDK